VMAFCNELPRTGRAIALITHAGPMRVIAAALEGTALEQFHREIGYGEVLPIGL
jgi:broad specificity phosphatase PhoE